MIHPSAVEHKIFAAETFLFKTYTGKKLFRRLIPNTYHCGDAV